jgi:hypothetical protein
MTATGRLDHDVGDQRVAGFVVDHLFLFDRCLYRIEQPRPMPQTLTKRLLIGCTAAVYRRAPLAGASVDFRLWPRLGHRTP